MKPTLVKALVFALLCCTGCDQLLKPPPDPGSSDFTGWLQSMTKVKVMYSGAIDIHTYLKQGSLDPGNTSDNWFPCELEFSNVDSTFFLTWQDSSFTTKSCSAFREIDPSFGLADACGDQSLLRGVYHSQSNSISNVLGMLQSYHGSSDPNNYQEQSASLACPLL